MATLANRAIFLKTQLGEDVLLPLKMSAQDNLSEPFRIDLDLLSEKGDLDPDQLLGKLVTVSFKTPASGAKRHFNGFVTEFSQDAYRGRFHEYSAVVRPWFWLLTRTADCRIFQEKSVPDIFEQVIKAYGFTDYELKLKGTYQKWEYCVQYRETDFNFLSRLLEQEGIYYYFTHTDSKHTMILVDDSSAHGVIEGYDKAPFFPPDAPEAQRESDHLDEWTFTKAVRSTAYATTDFNFENPSQTFTALLRTETMSRKHAYGEFEVFDYPAELAQFSGGEATRVAKMRIEELQASYTVMSGSGNSAGLTVGHRFKLEKYPRKDLNIEYLIVGSTLSIASDAYDVGQDEEEAEFSISIDAIDLKTPYRPERTTPKPVVQGAQTAIVVGPSGEEIYTDEHGRVKVQFHWDRYGKSDEKSSCWMRVAQVWAGKQWGAIHIPRIGQEVIVSFLEGDPDQPIITGRVYNGDSKPPYDLPGNKTQSGIKSRSSKGGAAANFNEIRFEDKKGAEQLYIHAEKNQDIVVENDESHSVGHDRSKSIGHDETTEVGNNRTETVGVHENITIGANRIESVGANESISIGSNRTISVGASETATVALQRTHAVGINESIAIGAAQEIAVGAAQTITVGAVQSVTVGANQSINVGGNRSISIGKDQTIKAGGNLSTEVGKDEALKVGGGRATDVAKDDALKVGKNLILEAGDSVLIKTGSASITMKKDGTITIKGKDITIEGSGKINVKASSDLTLKGSKIAQN